MTGEGFVRTMPSVMTQLKTAASKNTAKRALSIVSKQSGDVLEASSAGALPRGRQQIIDMRRKEKDTRASDSLFSLMVMCKKSEGKNSRDAFVRLVNAAPFSMMLLAYDWTLDDIVRFCTHPGDSSIFSIDPTFSLSAFKVTVTMYRHLLLHLKGERSKAPTMIDPLFIYFKKDSLYVSFYCFIFDW